MSKQTASLRQRAILFVWLLLAAVTRALAQDQPVYADSLQSGWQFWGWATINLANSSPVHGGSSSISISSSNWQALYLHHDAQNGSYYTNISFWVNGGPTGGQLVQV